QVRSAPTSVNATRPAIPVSPIDLEPSISNINPSPAPNSPQMTHHRSRPVNKGDLKRQRSITGRNRITSDFSPSPSPKSVPIVSRPTIYPSTKLLQQITTSQGPVIQNEKSVFS